MRLRRAVNGLLLGCAMAWLAASGVAMASEYHGQVTFGGLPVPGTTVTVTATQGSKKAVAVSDDQGVFRFADLADGTWSIDIEMTGFAPIKQDVTVGPSAPAGTFEMKLLTLEQVRAAAKPVKVAATAPVAVAQGTGNGEQGTASAAATSVAAPSTQVSGARPGAPASGAGTAAPTAKGAAAAGKGAAAATTQAANGAAPSAAALEPAPDPNAQQASDGFLINGSVNNAATSQFSQSAAFGNNRGPGRSLYNGGLSLVLDNSAFDAKQFSISGLDSPKPAYNNIQAGINFAGPLKIPHLLPVARAPYFYVFYRRTQGNRDNTQAALIPTPAQQLGDLTGAGTVYDPSTGKAYVATNCLPALFAVDATPTACIPQNEISSVAQNLLKLYPSTPNVTGNTQYNYQIPLTSSNRQDEFQAQMSKGFGNKDYVNGRFAIQSTRTGSTNLFGFHDSTAMLGDSFNVNWSHRFTQRFSLNTGYNFSYQRSQTTPYFVAKRVNESQIAGITGNDQTDPANYGVPSLGFSSGISGLSDATSSRNRSETNSLSGSVQWNHLRHNATAGGDFRRQESNTFSQQNPEGSLSFNGTATQLIPPCPPGTSPCPAPTGGWGFADFLLGIPDTSNIAFGNADKYYRQSVYDAYVNDDFRVNPELSLNYGLRWEYSAPVTELKGRLVNLDIARGFTGESPVVGSSPVGPLTGTILPAALVRPDRIGLEPRVSIAWRPISGSSLLVRSSYGITRDTSVYQATASAMAQQSPLSTSLSIPNSTTCPLTLAAPFPQKNCGTTTADQFAIDPNFRIGYVQTWDLSVERDLPFSLHGTVRYLGIKGTRGPQEFLPNTCPPGTTDTSTCSFGPSGYYYRTSNGNLEREGVTTQLRRRLRSGFTASVNYTFSKSLDDDYSLSGQGSASGGGGVAQNWLDVARGQRGLSTTDQRHVLSATVQYTTGMGLGGRALMSGWRGAVYKEWTFLTNINAATGLPQTPIYGGAAVLGTGVTGPIRPTLTGVSPSANLAPGYFVNINAYKAPSGEWGDARRDSITGPGQFSLSASMARTFRLHGRYNLDARLDASNALNHVVYSGWNTTYIPNSTQFGAPVGANGMRSMSITMRLRF